ncbi:hypothetical protein [Enterococcus sp. RIT-PI-f]|uniref:hypothetical protein n=1 Tax=Enterococcus sp. RIT-PI-f TaxID=1690244 RepID=UPI0006CD7AD1|nr:hypothetical protein [Enterococcus sp. RIT-PI-f]KPG72107.1 hypothetical protein AEQ18_02415 [Enterococcus sp. RIT-PI-f]
MNNQKWVAKLPKIILAFVCSLCLFSLLVLGVLRATLFNQEFMVDQVHDTKYAETIAKEINTNITDIGLASNIPAEVLSEVVPAEVVQQNVDSYIRGIYTDVPFNLIGTDQIEDNMDQAVAKYAEEQNITISEEMTANLTYMKESAISIFDQYVKLPYLLTYGHKVMQFDDTLILLFIVTGVVFLLLLIGTMMVIGKWWHRRLRYGAYISGGAGLMLVVVPMLIYTGGYIERIAINSEAIYLFLTSYLTDFILRFVWVGVGMIVLAVILWGVSEPLRVKMRNAINH